jgi:3',5'-cyclic AMP phosphodiesterase CpdA
MREPDGWYYTFRQGPVAFIVLDAGEDKPDSDVEYGGLAEYDPYRQAQLEWLKEAVKRPEIASAPIKICMIHIPAFKDKTTWYAQNWANENFVPVLNAAGVNLMLSGHIHKHKMIEAGHSGNNFPILCSSNNERFVVSSDGRTITVEAYDTAGKLTKSYNL